MHCLWPASACVEQLLVSALGEVTDGALGDAILEVGIDAAEGELLSCVVAGLLEGSARCCSGSAGSSCNAWQGRS